MYFFNTCIQGVPVYKLYIHFSVWSFEEIFPKREGNLEISKSDIIKIMYSFNKSNFSPGDPVKRTCFFPAVAILEW